MEPVAREWHDPAAAIKEEKIVTREPWPGAGLCKCDGQGDGSATRRSQSWATRAKAVSVISPAKN
jgi:hypothetical protein